jgi:hypothetical protein
MMILYISSCMLYIYQIILYANLNINWPIWMVQQTPQAQSIEPQAFFSF